MAPALFYVKGLGEAVAGIIDAAGPAALGMFASWDAALIDPAATLDTLRHWREGTVAIAQPAGKRRGIRVVTSGAAPADIYGAVGRTLADVVSSGKGVHGLMCLGTVQQ